MLFVLSPAKALDFDTPAPTPHHTQPQFTQHAQTLIQTLRQYTPAQLAQRMGLSDKLAQLNAARFAAWEENHTHENAKQALFAFNGDVYEGLQAQSLDDTAYAWLQAHLRILSGLYGVLRPLDWMQPYRLEMGSTVETAQGKTLYAYWGNTITEALNTQLAHTPTPVLFNVASNEYFKSVNTQKLKAQRLITPVFEDWKTDRYAVISFYAKRARGLFVRYACTHRASEPDALKEFDLEHYAFEPTASTENRWVFRRRLAR